MKILILGGTGAIGIDLINILKKKHLVYITSRSVHTSEKNIVYVKGNAHHLKFLNDVLEMGGGNKWDAIVDFMSYSTSEFEERIDLFLNATKQYVFMSSARVYANMDFAKINENMPRILEVTYDKDYLLTDEYALSKARQENLLIGHNKKNYTIIRPYITYNYNRLQLGIYEKEQWLLRALNKKPIVFSKDIANKITTMTYAGDVSYLISELLGRKNALGETFNITSGETLKWKEVLQIYITSIEEFYGIHPVVIYKDNAVVPKHQFYQYKYDRMYNRIFDNNKILDTIGIKYNFLNIQDGLYNCITEFLKKDIKCYNINYKMEAMFDKSIDLKVPITSIKRMKDKIKYLYWRY